MIRSRSRPIWPSPSAWRRSSSSSRCRTTPSRPLSSRPIRPRHDRLDRRARPQHRPRRPRGAVTAREVAEQHLSAITARMDCCAPIPTSPPIARFRRRRRSTGRGPLAKTCRRSPALPSRPRTCSTSQVSRRARGQRSTDRMLRPRMTRPCRPDGSGGRVLLGGLNMGEYAYDFTGRNAHDGASRNPHDPARMTGGSSGGSGGAPRRRPGHDHARLRHQWLDPRARLALRPFRPEADLRRSFARRHLSLRREPRPCRPAGAVDPRPSARL